jgi:hypothetical protein
MKKSVSSKSAPRSRFLNQQEFRHTNLSHQLSFSRVLVGMGDILPDTVKCHCEGLNCQGREEGMISLFAGNLSYINPTSPYHDNLNMPKASNCYLIKESSSSSSTSSDKHLLHHGQHRRRAFTSPPWQPTQSLLSPGLATISSHVSPPSNAESGSRLVARGGTTIPFLITCHLFSTSTRDPSQPPALVGISNSQKINKMK